MSLPYNCLNPNVQKSKGAGNARFAPHKPLLLLCLFDMAEAGLVDGPVLKKSADLRLRFDSYWSICQPRWGGQPGLDLPFHHLSTQGFWEPHTKEHVQSRGPDGTDYVILSGELLTDLHDSQRRDSIRKLLVTAWFPDSEQSALFSALGFSPAKLRRLAFLTPNPDTELEQKGRDARFRVTVVTQYRFTCALTGYGAHTRHGHTIVEAAHIHAFSKSRNNHPTNGLALSRDAHWMFDRGLWTIDPQMRVLVAEEIFTEWGPEAEWLKVRHRDKVCFADGVALRPAERHLLWHRENVFGR